MARARAARPTLRQRLGAQWPRITSYAAPLLFVLALVGGDRLVVLACAALIWVIAAAASLAVGWQGARAAGAREIVLEPVGAVRSLLADDRALASATGRSHWWVGEGAQWIGNLLVHWRRTDGLPADRLSLEVERGSLRDDVAGGLDDAPAWTRERRPEPDLERVEKIKAALVEARGLLTDEPAALVVRRLDWPLAQWAVGHFEQLLARNPSLSLFGVAGATPHPGILCAHSVIRTSDGWTLLSLRRGGAAYHAGSWSASFEEQVDLDHDGTVGDTVRRGLREEFGLREADVADIRTLAIGSECLIRGENTTVGAVVVSKVQLAIDRTELWEVLDRRHLATDVAEHEAWVAAALDSTSAVNRLIEATGPRTDGSVAPDLLRSSAVIDVVFEVHPRSDGAALVRELPWHPSARARLVLAAEHAEAAASS